MRHPAIQIGDRFGRLTVIAEAGRHRKERAWLCRCDCGTERRVKAYSLRSGETQSCGCLFTEMLVKRNYTHGLTGTPGFEHWRGMMRRCYDAKAKQFKDYGGRGISVCARWHAPDAFIADMGERPAGAQLDRIDNDGNYEPGNCRWATRATQMLNRRGAGRYFTLDDQPITLAAMAHQLAIPRTTLRDFLVAAEGGAR